MNKDYTHITVVLDRSGSMQSCWTDTMGGLKTLIKDQKTENSKCSFSLYSFDDIVENKLNFVDIQSVTDDVQTLGISPRGSTALYDAIGKAISETGSILAALKEDDRPGRVMFVIQTDGQENASREYKSAVIAELIKKQTDVYSWQFQFIGADKASVLEAQNKLGFLASNTAFYDTRNSADTFDILTSKLKASRSVSHDAYMTGATMAFTESELKSMAEV